MQKKSGKRLVKFWTFFLLATALSLAVTVIYVQSRMQLEKSQMEQIAMSRANKVNNVLTKLLYKTQILSATVVRSGGDIQDFEQIAATVLDDPSIKNLIVAPDGIITHVYPLEGNEQVIGFNYFSEGAGNAEAVLARDTGQLVLGGPFELVQGGQALVGRLPIYLLDGRFWGIVSVTLYYPQALDGAELDQLKSQGFAYELWRISSDTGERQIIAGSQYDYNKNSRYVEYPMNLLNAEWYFRLSPIRAWYEFPETWVFVIAGLFISFLIGLLMMHNYDLLSMKKDLEELSFQDPLTGILNRRGGFQALQNTEISAPYILCYIDLDNFKEINDKLGHNAGDFVLQWFTEIVQKKLKHGQHIFARIGGDEFILIQKRTNDIESMKAWLGTLQESVSATPFLWEGQEIKVGFSIGLASFPEDGTTLDDLLAIADKRMYTYKNMSREN